MTRRKIPGPDFFPAMVARAILKDMVNTSEIIFVVEEAPEGGYVARALDAAIFTEAENANELHERVRDAVRCHFEEGQAPKVIRLHFVRDEVIATA